MSKPPLTAGEIALTDQLLAAVNEDVVSLAKSVRAGDVLRGEAQNTADFIAYLSQKHSPESLAALFVAAVRRIPDSTITEEGEPDA